MLSQKNCLGVRQSTGDLLRRIEPVAGATDGVQQPRLALALQFLPQLLHVHFDHIGVAAEVLAPDPIE